MRTGLSVYGTIYSMGITPASGRSPITTGELIAQARKENLSGIDLPASLIRGNEDKTLIRAVQQQGFFVVLETSGYKPDELETSIKLAAQLEIPTIRTVVGGARLGGDRRPLAGKWQEFLQEILAGLKQATALATDVGVTIALENHQDLASEELSWLCNTINSPHFGITLDTGNPLATAEEPIDFAQRMAPYIKHVHLKDYWIYPSPEGYRLVRCPLGQGVIDFPALLQILAQHCPQVTMSIELGALEARHVRVLADDYWPDYPPRTAAQLAHVLHFVTNHAQTGDWHTPFEEKKSAHTIAAYEQQQLAESLLYLQNYHLISTPEQ